jgi:hypothetical protein
MVQWPRWWPVPKLARFVVPSSVVPLVAITNPPRHSERIRMGRPSGVLAAPEQLDGVDTQRLMSGG